MAAIMQYLLDNEEKKTRDSNQRLKTLSELLLIAT